MVFNGQVVGINAPLLLRDTRVDSDGWKTALLEQLVELSGTDSGLDENDDLVEGEGVEELVELAVLLGLGELDVVLAETVKGQLGLTLLKKLDGVLHELLANRDGLLRKSGGEHHHLLVGRGLAEDLLDVAAHV